MSKKDGTELKNTVVSMLVHRESENPMLGRQSIQVSLEDEGAGVYFRLIDSRGGEISIDPDELEAAYKTAKVMYASYPEEYRDPPKNDAGQ